MAWTCIFRHIEAEGSGSLECRVRTLGVRNATLPCQFVGVDIETVVTVPVDIGTDGLLGHRGRNIDGEHQLLSLRHTERFVGKHIIRLVGKLIGDSHGDVAHVGRPDVVGIGVGLVAVLCRQTLHPTFLKGNGGVLLIKVKVYGRVFVRHDAALRQVSGIGTRDFHPLHLAVRAAVGAGGTDSHKGPLVGRHGDVADIGSPAGGSRHFADTAVLAVLVEHLEVVNISIGIQRHVVFGERGLCVDVPAQTYGEALLGFFLHLGHDVCHICRNP